jgi:ubiquinone/menaquinone biosynthesis C-methylase UbiE
MNHPQTPSPRWGALGRDRKAANILATLRGLFPTLDIVSCDCADIGCGNGEIAYHLADKVRNMTGVDPEPWAGWHLLMEKSPNLNLIEGTAESLPLPDSSLDIVICNQVYEHVISPTKLIREIERILKPGGVCYFAGPNLLFPIEPHVFWPFVHWLPRRIATRLMKGLGSSAILDAYSTHYWRLLNWLDQFIVTNALPFILRNPSQFARTGLFWKIAKIFPTWAVKVLTPLSPAFIFVLQKPK